MDLRIYRNFLSVIAHGSINKAASSLQISQPALSRQIAQLEEDLGILLFERGNGALKLTEQGRLAAKRTEELLRLEEKMRGELQNMGNELSGTLTIGSGEFRSINPLLAYAQAFRQKHPAVSITLITGNADQCRDLLEKGILDLALFLNPANLSGLETLHFGQEESWCAIVPKTDPLAAKESIAPSDLCSIPLILPYRSEPETGIMQWLKAMDGEPVIAGRTSLTSNGASMVLNSLGVLLSISGVPAFQHPDLIEIPLQPAIRTHTLMAWKDKVPASRLLASFLHFVKEQQS